MSPHVQRKLYMYYRNNINCKSWAH